MEAIVKARLEAIRLGELQRHGHVAVMPIIGVNGPGPEYLTLKEALETDRFQVTEVTEGGNVPELKVINRGKKPVLLLDGEELAGAKQNRVLNTTILIKEMSETIIPVSCTEHGRWSYRTACFEASGHLMSTKLRRIKNASVHENLKAMRAFRSDQCEIWDEIAAQASINQVSPLTGAMKDVLDAKQEDLDAFLAHFPPFEGQQGLIVLVNSKVVGIDVLSRPAAFAVLHPKLIRSYVMDALTERPAKGKMALKGNVVAFLKQILQCQEQVFDSVGYGRDCRYEGGKIVGSALEYKGTVIHMAFFPTTETEKAGYMASASRRRANRTK